MLLRVKLIGSGTPADPHRVNLPTYSLVHGNVDEGYAIVNVAESDIGLTTDELDKEQYVNTTEGRLYLKLGDEALRKAHDHMDERYAEHKGRFRVESA